MYVQSSTIFKAIQHTGFITILNENKENVPDNTSEDELFIKELCKRKPPLPEISFQGFFKLELDEICMDEISDEQIIIHIRNEKKQFSDSFRRLKLNNPCVYVHVSMYVYVYKHYI